MNSPYIQLAPMEGVLDWVLRDLLSEVGGLDRMVTEFVRVTDKLMPEHVFLRYCPELERGGMTSSGTPVFLQLLGGEINPMAENAGRAAEMGAPGIDLNFGCPAKTVNRHDGGAALLKIPQRLFDVTSAVRRAVPAHIPVTAKVRLGFEHKEFHREISAAIEESRADHVVVHARTKVEMYAPPAHWEYIALMRKGRSLRHVANGDIWDVGNYFACVQKSGVPDVALGRGLVSRPTLALNIRAAIAKSSLAIDFNEVEFLNKFFTASLKWKGIQFAVARMKQLLRYWSRNDARMQMWFEQVKVMKSEIEVQTFLRDLALRNV